jgi:hypothetical protein
MKFIAHRGNIMGPNTERENSPSYIDEAIDAGFDVEVDVWVDGGRIALGHDSMQYDILATFLFERAAVLWCHAKNLEALIFLTKNSLHTFSHDNDDYVLTSKGVIWSFPGRPIGPDVICVMPERADYTPDELKRCKGICSDFVAQIIF